MKIQFDILNQEIDFTEVFKSERKQWWFANCRPIIPPETNIEDLTEIQKISLIKLAIYEGYLGDELLCNLKHDSFKIKGISYGI